ncbi:unnamed protein product [Spirodela intermedia]|uniref:cytokinin dehydrogenase n=1 Tax=Spirodela intermedia TaxID=51605 RepID=A0A7I8J3J2_SPIIN|nr:unnamed protein product [Spirodela intermedia]CAA6664669.1 unnamed protein product [Spirodela intermedia]
MAAGGVVLEMRPSMASLELVPGATPAVRAGAGALWDEVLEWCVGCHGLAPRSWTDYLGLTVGGTLSNGGISGQAFRFGPQTANVIELEVTRCSDLFFAALGGLGQFGVITAPPSPSSPRPTWWMRVVYADFEHYAGDAEWLVSRAAAEAGEAFDYVEGFVLVNADDPVNGGARCPGAGPEVRRRGGSSSRRSSPLLPRGGGLLRPPRRRRLRGQGLLRRLRHVRRLEFRTDVSYVGFLSRVKRAEEEARGRGIWDGAAHPWLNLLVSKGDIADFDRQVFKRILRGGVGGPMLVYPLLKSRWDPRASVALPAGEVFYLGPPTEELLAQNQEVVDCCVVNGYDFKMYLPHYRSRDQWERHFGEHYDPLAILSPGQRIFRRGQGPLGEQDN